MEFKGMGKGGGLLLTSAVVLGVTIAVQATQGVLRFVVLGVGVVIVYLLFSFLLQPKDT